MNQKVKFLIPALIILIVVGIWFVKNNPFEQKDVAVTSKEKSKKSSSDGEATNQSVVEGGDSKTNASDKENADFNFEFEEALDFEALKKYGLPMIIDFGSASCAPCVHMHPDLEAIHEEYKGKAIVKYADVWKSADAAKDLPIRVTPTQILITADGKPYQPSEMIAKLMGPTSFTSYQSKATGEIALTVHEGMLSQDEMRVLLKEMGVKE